MLSLLAAWLLLLPACVVTGAAVAAMAGWPSWMTRGCDRFFTAAFLGLLTCCSLALTAALFTPLYPWLLAAPYIFLAVKQVRLEVRTCLPEPRTIATLALFAVILAGLESIADPLYDAALYHNQLISWMSTYGLAPGLGLLHYRLGFSSSWLALTAVFDHGVFIHRMGRTVTGFAMLLLAVQTAWAFLRCFRFADTRSSGERARDWFLVGAMPVLLAISTREALGASPSPNFAAAAAIVMAAWLVLDGPATLAFLVACGATAVKLSAAPAALMLVPRARPAVWLLAIALGGPIFWANYRTTGCPAYPASFCFDVPHSVGAPAAKHVALETLNFARNLDNYQAPYANAGWIVYWAAQWDNQVVFLPAALGLLVILLTRTWNRAVALALAAMLYCLLTAPGPRFAFGAAAVLTGVAAVAVHRYPLFRAVVLGCSALLVGNCLLIIWLRAPQTDPSTFWLLPTPAYLHGEQGRLLNHHGLTFHVPPLGDRCGALPVPCTPYPPGDATHLCDSARGLSGGFCRVTLPR